LVGRSVTNMVASHAVEFCFGFVELQ